jgi:hypothetical protein
MYIFLLPALARSLTLRTSLFLSLSLGACYPPFSIFQQRGKRAAPTGTIGAHKYFLN